MKYENVWIKINEDNINSDNVNIIKKDLHYMKSIRILFLTIEIDIIPLIDMNEINIKIPDLNYIFSNTEINTFAIKNEDINVPVKIITSPKNIKIEGFFNKDCNYEFNFQKFLKL